MAERARDDRGRASPSAIVMAFCFGFWSTPPRSALLFFGVINSRSAAEPEPFAEVDWIDVDGLPNQASAGHPATSEVPDTTTKLALPSGSGSVMSVKSFLVVASLAVSVLIGLVLGRGSAAAGGGPATGKAGAAKVITIGLSMDTLKEARWAKDRDAFIARANQLGAQVTVFSANGDDTRQIADVGSLIASGVNVIVVVPHDGKAMAKGVEVA